jgi:hypothetical protein
MHRKSASAAVALGGIGQHRSRRSRQPSGLGGNQLHSIDSGASDESGGMSPTLGGPLPSSGGGGMPAEASGPGKLQPHEPAPPQQ